MRINVIIVIIETRTITNFTPQIFYAILMALHGLASRKVAKESLDRVQVGVYDVCIAGCSMLEWPEVGFMIFKWKGVLPRFERILYRCKY